ncbi:MAG: AAA family ATPase [Actinobacteria bacterium]|nr:AAA family ATPase [Actinomycetota bacterium]
MDGSDEVGEFDLAAAYTAVGPMALPPTTDLTPAEWDEWLRIITEDETTDTPPEPGAADDTTDPGHGWQYAAGHDVDEDREAKRARWRKEKAQYADLRADEMFVVELAKLKAQRLAREEDENSRTAGLPAPDIATLAELLQRPAPSADRIQGLMPWDASVTVVAQNKVGKTTFVLNLTRSLITGEPFLGRFEVQPIDPDARVAILNYEVSGAQLARWAAEVGIPGDRLVIVNLRGARNPLSTSTSTSALADLLRPYNIETLIVDPFGRGIGGQDQNSARDVQPWLNRLDSFARDGVGALDLVLVVHSGWNGERSRGSSALEDWPDAKWYLTKDAAGLRYFRAEGRDVDVEEDQLAFEPETRRLTLTGQGNRSTAGKTHTLMILRTQVLDYLEANPGASGNAIEEAISANSADIRVALRSLVGTGQVIRAKRSGKGGGFAYMVVSAVSEGGIA